MQRAELDDILLKAYVVIKIGQILQPQFSSFDKNNLFSLFYLSIP